VRIILFAAMLTMCPGQAGSRIDRVNLFPKLQVGQTITYEISYRSEKQTKTRSSVLLAEAPPTANVEVRGLLRFEVLGVRPERERAIIHARTRFASLHSGPRRPTPNAEPSPDQAQPEDREEVYVEFTILPDGRIDQVKGLDALLPEEQQAWQEWASCFAGAAVFPGNGVGITQKWKGEEPERAPSPIAGLSWTRKSTYMRNEPCRTAQLSVQGDVVESDQQPDTCAVIFTTAALKQQSSPKNSTPEDFKLHQLRTMGTARGANNTITFISLKTRLVVRAAEEASQSMDVTIAKTDGSNRVHYDVSAKSHSEILLVADVPLNRP
jgi:hypothetical protein